MPRLTTEQMEELDFGYVDAAIDIVIASGWGGLSMRRLAQKVGKAVATLHEHFTSDDLLRQRLVAEAFIFTGYFEAKPMEVPLSSIQEATRLFNIARTDPRLAALMTQVTANAATPTSSLRALYRREHEDAAARLVEAMQGDGFGSPAQRIRRGRRMVNRYVGICAMIAADPELTVTDGAATIT